MRCRIGIDVDDIDMLLLLQDNADDIIKLVRFCDQHKLSIHDMQKLLLIFPAKPLNTFSQVILFLVDIFLGWFQSCLCTDRGELGKKQSFVCSPLFRLLCIRLGSLTDTRQTTLRPF